MMLKYTCLMTVDISVSKLSGQPVTWTVMVPKHNGMASSCYADGAALDGTLHAKLHRSLLDFHLLLGFLVPAIHCGESTSTLPWFHGFQNHPVKFLVVNPNQQIENSRYEVFNFSSTN